MGENRLEIILTLVDEASDKLKQAFEKTQKSADKFGETLATVGKQTSILGTRLIFLGGVITGTFAVALKSMNDKSVDVHDSLERLNFSFTQFQRIVAEAVVPIVNRLSGMLAKLVDIFKNMDEKTRDHILQWALMVGVIITVTGIFLKLAGTIEFVIGKVTRLIFNLNPINIALIAISIAIIYMITHWEKVREIVLPIIDKLQIAADWIAISWLKTAQAMANAFTLISSMLGQQDFSVYLQEQVILIDKQIQDFQDNMTGVMDKTGNKWSETVDGFMTDLNDSLSLMKNLYNTFFSDVNSAISVFGEDFSKQLATMINKVQSLGQQSATIVINSITSLTDKFGNSLGKMIIEGQNFSKSMQAAFREMAIDFIAQVSAMIAKWVAFTALKAAGSFFGLPFFHSGGIVRAHSGLAVDEVPIIAQTGERILSRSQNAAFERGMSGRQTSIYIEINNPVVRNDENIKTLAEEVSKEIARTSERL